MYSLDILAVSLWACLLPQWDDCWHPVAPGVAVAWGQPLAIFEEFEPPTEATDWFTSF